MPRNVKKQFTDLRFHSTIQSISSQPNLGLNPFKNYLFKTPKTQILQEHKSSPDAQTLTISQTYQSRSQFWWWWWWWWIIQHQQGQYMSWTLGCTWLSELHMALWTIYDSELEPFADQALIGFFSEATRCSSEYPSWKSLSNSPVILLNMKRVFIS